MTETQAQIVASAIFVLAYVLIAWEKVHKTAAALAGAAAMLLLKILTQQEAFHGHDDVHGIDWNTILLLTGMMVIVGITKETGVFEWLALKSAKVARGRPMAILAMLSLITAVLSAMLDNVTTVLLIAPVAIVICRTLEIDPVPMLICCVLASNIGGTATLIGDPPNIMIASAAGLTFLDFLRVDAPVCGVALLAFLGAARLVLAPKLQVAEERRLMVLQFDESKTIHDRKLLTKCLIVVSLTMVGFVLHGPLGLEPATIALSGAALLLILYGKSPAKVLEEVEWPTIFFFMGLFIMVSGLVKVGVVRMLAGEALNLTGGNTSTMTVLVLWLSAVASGIIDNIPFVATMNSLVIDIAHSVTNETGQAALHHASILPVWWALSLGACLGGNMTLVGASANVVVAGIAGSAGHPISFVRFMKYGVPVTLLTVVISMGYLWVIFLR
jgi:Na+/H+ antiporter NhaD/arsenite permease-like protein